MKSRTGKLQLKATHASCSNINELQQRSSFLLAAIITVNS